MADKPAFVARKFQDAQRLAAKGFSCPLCSETFQAEPKLWEHAKSQHKQTLGYAGSVGEAEARKRFRSEAVPKAYVMTVNRRWGPAILGMPRHNDLRRVIRDTPPPIPKPSSNDNDSMKPNIGEDVRARSPIRSTSAQASMLTTEKQIHDLGKLTLEQDQTPTPSPESQQNFPSSNPLKRGAMARSGYSDFPMEDDPSVHVKSRARHAKTQSASSLGKKGADKKVDRPLANDPSFMRSSVGSGKRLYDPERDNPVSNPVARKNKASDRARTNHRGGSDDPRSRMFHLRDLPNVDTKDRRLQTPQQPPKFLEKLNPQDHEISESSPPMDRSSSSNEPHDQDIEPDPELDSEPVLLLQPETRPISHDQLVVEVKGIYAGLVMVESKCADVDEKQSKAAQEKDPSRRKRLSNEQWQALIHLHKTLLHEHHDFFLASQHPSASPALSRLAAKYSMPARMWRHGIHSFLEVLRHMLPESLDHMLAFVYIAYSMMALLYETVPTFEDTWIECLGDLARYRMAIEEDDIRDREIWSGVARLWSLTCVVPFENAHSSIMTLFNPILSGKSSAHYRPESLEAIFIKCHGILFCNLSREQFDTTLTQMQDGLFDNYIGRVGAKFKEQGVFATLTNIAALFEYGALRANGQPKSIFRLAYNEIRHRNYIGVQAKSQHSDDLSLDLNGSEHQPSPPPFHSLIDSLTSEDLRSSLALIRPASKFMFSILSICLRRIGDRNVFPSVHVSFVFLLSLTGVDKAMKYVEQDVPWVEICSFLNALAKPEVMTEKVRGRVFPKPDNGIGRPLPDDFGMRGLLYAEDYFPVNWFSDAAVDDEERSLELPSMAAPRVERILWLGIQIASLKRWIAYDSTTNHFHTTDYADKILTASTQPLEEQMEISVSDTDDQHMSEAVPLSKESEKVPTSPSREGTDALSHVDPTSAAEMQRLRHVTQNESEPASPMKDIETTRPTKSDDSQTASWLKNAALDEAKRPSKKGPVEDLTSDPRKLRLMGRFDRYTGLDPEKS
ncbi:MAG: hypothetical protein Q9191_006030 [Dirinaria sp. TL-2023a]